MDPPTRHSSIVVHEDNIHIRENFQLQSRYFDDKLTDI